MERKKLMNAAQVAEWLNVKESTIRKWVHYGFIPHIKLGRCVRFSEEDIQRWLKESSEKGKPTLLPEIKW